MEEYPIHPTLDKLIQSFKAFTQVPFPRGIPDKPRWNQIIRALTTFEREVISRAQNYMAGGTIETTGLSLSDTFKKAFADFRCQDATDDEYMTKIRDYQDQLERIAEFLLDCVDELGNPFEQARH